LTAFDESSGAQVWQQNVSGTNAAPAVTVDGVYAAPVCFAFDLQPATGAVIWSNNTGCEGGGGNTPVVGGGRMYAPLSPGFYAGNVYAAESGQVLGAFSASAPPAISTSSVFTLNNSTLQGTALSNDQILWSFAGDGTLVTSPIVVNNFVFVGGSSGNLYALDATTGSQLWTKNLGAAIAGPATGGSATQGATGLAAGDGLLIVPAGNKVNAFVLSTNPQIFPLFTRREGMARFRFRSLKLPVRPSLPSNGIVRVVRGCAAFLKSAASSAAISINEKRNHKCGNDQSDRTNAPARTHTPIQTAATTKYQQQNYQNDQQIHKPLLNELQWVAIEA
jgi:hypothetical protein